ncbi:MAG: hypothetical protein COA88_15870 [Kordia sp.]|nr:MAG: hypothetical protein COA88_15870 [Kordia sp.]
MKIPKSIFLTILYYVVSVLIGFWILLIPDEIEYINLLKSSHLYNTIVTLVVLIIAFKLIKRSDLLNLEKADTKYYLIAILSGIGFVCFQPFLNAIYHQEISTDIFQYNFTFDRLSSLNVLASILIVPVTEELYFRNYIQRGLSKNYNPLKTIIITSILFAFIHIPFAAFFYEVFSFSLNQTYIALFGGLISGTLLYKSNSITPSIIFHIFWNLASYVL